MSRPARVEYGEERLDQPIDDVAGHEVSLGHLRSINTWLGGTRALRKALLPFCVPGARAAFVDVGCGGADIALHLAHWARSRGADASVFAVDRGHSAVRFARLRTIHEPDVHVLCADAASLPLADRSLDVGMMTLTLHHFDTVGRIAVLRELARVARTLVVVNDLERSWPNYLGAKLLAATLWRSNRFTRHDAPLSVLRSFTPGELRADFHGAGLDSVQVHRRFFYRLVATGAPPSRDAAARTL